MINKELGIGILDIYDDASLIECTKSLAAADPQGFVSTYVITNRKTPLKDFVYDKKIGHSVSMATLRNHCLAAFRCAGLKYLFLINSNVVIKDPEFIQKTIATAEAFGTWFLAGYQGNPTVLDDADLGQSLCINNKLNTDFIFIRSGVVGNLGYFDERFVNTKDLDVLDYIVKARKIGIYPPHPYHATCGDYINYTTAKIDRIDHSDMIDQKNRSVGFSYGYFHHQHKYIPDHDEIKEATKDDLMIFMGDLQAAYAKKA